MGNKIKIILLISLSIIGVSYGKDSMSKNLLILNSSSKNNCNSLAKLLISVLLSKSIIIFLKSLESFLI